MKAVRLTILLLAILLINALIARSQTALDALKGSKGAKIGYIPPASGPTAYGKSPAITNKSNPAAAAPSFSNMVAGAMLQSLFSSLLSSPAADNTKELEAKRAADLEAQQAAEQQRINEENDQREYEKMMGSYKLLDGSTDLKIKPLGDTNLDFKTLDGDAETLAAGARKPFDVAGAVTASGSPSSSGVATPFFGETMSLEDIQTLLDVENNPSIVDLRAAKQFMDEKIRKDYSGIVALLGQLEPGTSGEPIIQKPDCIKLGKQLKGFINQRMQFQKTIELSRNELDLWETANRNALINSIKDGLEYFTGQLLEGFTNRGKVADRLQQITAQNIRQMTKEGVDVVGLQGKIDRLCALSSTGQVADFAANMNDWQTFVKDGMSSLITRFSNSNDEIKEFFEDPKLKKYFETEQPELSVLLDISKIAASNKIFGKWVAKKIPLIACIEISIKQTYNGLDYFLSLNRILKAQKINGGVMDASRYIQKNIDETYTALSECPGALP